MTGGETISRPTDERAVSGEESCDGSEWSLGSYPQWTEPIGDTIDGRNRSISSDSPTIIQEGSPEDRHHVEAWKKGTAESKDLWNKINIFRLLKLLELLVQICTIIYNQEKYFQ